MWPLAAAGQLDGLTVGYLGRSHCWSPPSPTLSQQRGHLTCLWLQESLQLLSHKLLHGELEGAVGVTVPSLALAMPTVLGAQAVHVQPRVQPRVQPCSPARSHNSQVTSAPSTALPQ